MGIFSALDREFVESDRADSGLDELNASEEVLRDARRKSPDIRTQKIELRSGPIEALESLIEQVGAIR